MDEAWRLIDLMDVHFARVQEAAEDNEFVDVVEAQRLHGLLRGALGTWTDLVPAQRRTLSEAVTYLVRTDDEEDDLRSPIGFEDDSAVVAAALRQIGLHDRQERAR
jgi:hypothetical protein